MEIQKIVFKYLVGTQLAHVVPERNLKDVAARIHDGLTFIVIYH
jgi:hypothetical protein